LRNNSKEERSDCTLSIEDVDPLLLLGPADGNLTALSRHYRTRFVCRGGQLILSGPKAEETEVQEVLARLLDRCRKGESITPELVDAEVSQVRRVAVNAPSVREAETGHVPGEVRTLRTPRKVIVPKTRNQQDYLEAIRRNDIVLCIGPAGTGKTYLAVAAALESLVAGRSSRIVLTRPAVEAGESLGYLPGTFKEKVDPYLRPLYDALFDMMPMERTKRLIEEEVIEVAPLAFMRGRTLSDAYIILDEAQNTIPTQMRMFLTRLGWNSKAIVTGDITQIDLAQTHVSGLVEAEERLRGVPGIAIVQMTKADVVRPPLVSRIIKAYEAKPAANEG
jgi:phosphate starvation-inducible PhoH-like protein